MESKKYQFLHDLKGFFLYIVVPLATIIIIVTIFSTEDDDGSSSNNQPSHHYTTAESIENYKDATEGKATKEKCGWCGGIGRVGYAGSSEAQVRRTGMGLGNLCSSCQGTGVIKVRH